MLLKAAAERAQLTATVLAREATTLGSRSRRGRRDTAPLRNVRREWRARTTSWTVGTERHSKSALARRVFDSAEVRRGIPALRVYGVWHPVVRSMALLLR